MSPLLIHKFGGTSLSDADKIRHLADIVRQHGEPAVVVVSALAGVTDRLEEALQRGAPAEDGLWAELEAHHMGVGTALELGQDLLAKGVRAAIATAVQNPRAPHAARGDQVLALGEDLSALLVAGALTKAGQPARVVDARSVVRTDALHGRAGPDAEAIRLLAQEHILPVVTSGEIAVVQGFVGATAEGVTTTLGRGGSDFTAALIGAALDASEIVIWTDVDGVLTCDPLAVENPRLLPEIGFEEAVELSYFGARVLHPTAAKHAAAAGVPLRIRNASNLKSEGTLVRQDRRDAAGFAAIAYKSGVVLFKVRAYPSAMAFGFLARVFEVLGRHAVPVDLVATSHSSTAFTIDKSENLSEVRLELEKFAEVEVVKGLTTVTVVGRGLLREPGIEARVLTAMDGTSAHLISQASDVSFSIVVADDDSADLVRRLHTTLLAVVAPPLPLTEETS